MSCRFEKEKQSRCSTKNIVYESVCTWCENDKKVSGGSNVVEGPTSHVKGNRVSEEDNAMEGPTTQRNNTCASNEAVQDDEKNGVQAEP